jgi:hypothetical protein
MVPPAKELSMATSPLLGTQRAPAEAPGRDAASLGPGDNSDSGSDRVGLDDDSDPNVPVDVALRDDQAPALPLGESTAATDGGDSGIRDGADIGVDRVFSPEGEDLEGVDDVSLVAQGDDDNDDDEGAYEDLPGESDPAERRPGRD